MQPEIYIDLDGVLADFDSGVQKATGIKYRPDNADTIWRSIEGLPNFFRHLDPKPDAEELYKGLRQTNLPIKVISSAPIPTDLLNTAAIDKQAWVGEHVDSFLIVYVVLNWQLKAEFAKPNAILIDDEQRNIDAWVAAGGIGILHTDANETLYQVNRILTNLKVDNVKNDALNRFRALVERANDLDFSDDELRTALTAEIQAWGDEHGTRWKTQHKIGGDFTIKVKPVYPGPSVVTVLSSRGYSVAVHEDVFEEDDIDDEEGEY